MVTSRVTKSQVERWKRLSEEKGPQLRPNRISGAELDEYFRGKYAPQPIEDENFRQTVALSAMERYGADAGAHIAVYSVDGVTVGIDIDSGFIHVECEDVRRCVPLYDDLFVTRGLDADDLQNFAIVGQYLELTEK